MRKAIRILSLIQKELQLLLSYLSNTQPVTILLLKLKEEAEKIGLKTKKGQKIAKSQIDSILKILFIAEWWERNMV